MAVSRIHNTSYQPGKNYDHLKVDCPALFNFLMAHVLASVRELVEAENPFEDRCLRQSREVFDQVTFIMSNKGMVQ
jgi:hypothetical protein